jgi:predicted DNA-binding protein YlxM (UPF0122 family)
MSEGRYSRRMAEKEEVEGKLSLEEILNKIFIEKDYSYFNELLDDTDVQRIFGIIISCYCYKNKGFFINRDFMKGVIESVIIEMTWKYFDINKCSNNNIKNGYLSFLHKYINGKVYQRIKRERPDELEYLVGDVCDIKKLIKQNYNNIDIVDFLYKHDEFESLINCCTDRQKEVLRLLFLHYYNEYDISKQLNISRNSVHDLKVRAINKIKKLLNKGDIYFETSKLVY